MRVLRSEESITAEIQSCPDRDIAHLLARHVQFASEYEDYDIGELLNVIVVEPGDTLANIDAEMGCQFLVNHYSGKRLGEPGFRPCFETLEEYPTFYEMSFVEGDEGLGIAVLIPKHPDVDAELIAMCALHASSAPDLSS